MHLVIDLHRAQKTDVIQSMLKEECKTEVTYVPGKSIVNRNAKAFRCVSLLLVLQAAVHHSCSQSMSQ